MHYCIMYNLYDIHSQFKIYPGPLVPGNHYQRITGHFITCNLAYTLILSQTLSRVSLFIWSLVNTLLLSMLLPDFDSLGFKNWLVSIRSWKTCILKGTLSCPVRKDMLKHFHFSYKSRVLKGNKMKQHNWWGKWLV